MWNIDWNKVAEVLTYQSGQPLIFSSGLFLFLFLGFSVIYALLQRKDNARLLFVLAFSYYFYYKSSGYYFFLLGVVTVTDYLLARKMEHTETRWKRKGMLAISICVNLGLLVYFKYTNFFGELIATLTHSKFLPLDIFLPIGISFFTFQSMSYTIDVYRKELQPLHRLLDYAFYVSFFPQLVAGPIVRARDFIPQIRRPLLLSRAAFGEGLFLIISGLFKKAILSDYISVNFVERIFDNPGLYSGVENLFGVYGYALQIYGDFSGYSDMAIGLALWLGFRFPQNFRSPYKADSITDFWHRWHISLSTWLRDYLYISLGGNRKGKFRMYLNLFLTMLLGGLWHGASLNFIFWGALHGIALALHKAWRLATGKTKGAMSHGVRRLGGQLLTFHFVCLCWIFFRNQTFEASRTMITKILTDFQPQLFVQLVGGYREVFVLMAIGFLLHFTPERWEERVCHGVIRTPFLLHAVLLAVVIYAVIQVKSSNIQPFIYFQF